MSGKGKASARGELTSPTNVDRQIQKFNGQDLRKRVNITPHLHLSLAYRILACPSSISCFSTAPPFGNVTLLISQNYLHNL